MTKFDKEIADLLIKAVSKGATFKLACDYAGIHFETLRRWRSFGQQEHENPDKEQTLYCDFYVRLKKAVGSHALACLDVIENAAEQGEWTAAAWKLERIHSKYYGKNSGEIEMAKRLDKLEEEQGARELENKKPTKSNHSSSDS